MANTLKLLWRYLWAGPNTMLGLAAAAASASLPTLAHGILLCRSNRGFANWFLTRRGYCAITLGHLVLVTSQASPQIMDHEMVHVRQSERWGPLFVPAYLTGMVIARVQGRDPYLDNSFELEARRQDGSSTPQGPVA